MSPILGSIGGLSARGFGFKNLTATPFVLTGSYDALGVVTVPSGGASSVTFAGIPQTGYRNLVIRGLWQVTSGGVVFMQFNNDSSSNYSRHYLQGDGSSASAGASSSYTTSILGYAVSSASYNYGINLTEILDYTNQNKAKTTRTLWGQDFNGSGYVALDSAAWYNNSSSVYSSINSIKITPNTGSFAQYSQFALYGVK